MDKSEETTGYLCGLPYNRTGHGPRILVVFLGLSFENKPLAGIAARSMLGMYKFLDQDYTTYVVSRKPGLPAGYSMRDMADDYATLIAQELGGPVDVLGTSTGGSIVQHFAADHPDLVRRLVIHSAAYTLSPVAKEAQLRTGHLASQGKWREAWAVLLRLMLARQRFAGLLVWIASLFMSLTAPKDPSDLVVTVEAEDKHDFRDRLAEITAPTLVIAGDQDPFYTEALFRDTAAGIPHAKLILYPGMGHPAGGEQFRRDVLAFLTAEG